MRIGYGEESSYNELENLLIGSRVVEVDEVEDIITLDNGFKVAFDGVRDCCSHWQVEELSKVDNVITKVDFKDGGDRDAPFHIFVYTAESRMNQHLLTVTGTEGNPGYYGTGYRIKIIPPPAPVPVVTKKSLRKEVKRLTKELAAAEALSAQLWTCCCGGSVCSTLGDNINLEKTLANYKYSLAGAGRAVAEAVVEMVAKEEGEIKQILLSPFLYDSIECWVEAVKDTLVFGDDIRAKSTVMHLELLDLERCIQNAPPEMFIIH